MTKDYTCPVCGTTNTVDGGSFGANFVEALPKNLGKAALVTAATILTGGLGGLLVGGIFYGKSVANYLNGEKITCKECGNDFDI